MTTATSEDTEITLGTGKMLALFFGLVALCAVFFGMGFSLGRSSVRIASPDIPPATSVNTSAARPSAVKATSTAPPPDMTFYKTVATKEADSQPTPKEVQPRFPIPAPLPLRNQPLTLLLRRRRTAILYR